MTNPGQPPSGDGLPVFGASGSGTVPAGTLNIWNTVVQQAGLNPTSRSIWFDSSTATSQQAADWWKKGLRGRLAGQVNVPAGGTSNIEADIQGYLRNLQDQDPQHRVLSPSETRTALMQMKQLAPDYYAQLRNDVGSAYNGPITGKDIEDTAGGILDEILAQKVPVSSRTVQNKATPGEVIAAVYQEAKNHPDEYRKLQQTLSDGSSIWGKVDVNGLFDPATQGALISAMQEWSKINALDPSLSFSDYMKQYSKSAKKAGSASTTPPVALQDPATIKAAAQAAAMNALGHGLNDDQLQKFVEQFQSAQTSAHGAEYANGATNYTAPDLSSQADVYAQSTDPNGFKQNQKQSYVAALVNLFSAPGDAGRPSQTPVPSAT